MLLEHFEHNALWQAAWVVTNLTFLPVTGSSYHSVTFLHYCDSRGKFNFHWIQTHLCGGCQQKEMLLSFGRWKWVFYFIIHDHQAIKIIKLNILCRYFKMLKNEKTLFSHIPAACKNWTQRHNQRLSLKQ